MNYLLQFLFDFYFAAIRLFSLDERVEAQGLDKPTYDVSTNEGVNLVETREVDREGATKSGAVEVDSRAHTHMNDKAWNLDMMLRRNAVIDTLSWSTAQPHGIVLTDYIVPFDLLKTAIQQAPFERFLYWRGKIRVRFQVNASRFHQGRLIAYYVPMQNQSQVNAWQESARVYQSSVQHVFLDPANNTTAELEIPFVHPKSWLCLPVADDYLGHLVVQVYNQLEAAPTVTPTIHVSVIVSMDNEFQVPIVSPPLTGMFALKAEAQGFTDSLKKGVFDGMDSAWKKIANSIRPSEIVGDVFDKATASAMMDKPNDTLQPQYLVRKPIGYFNHAQQIEHIEKLNLYPGALNMCDQEHFGTERDEMDLQYLVSIPGYLNTADWSEAAGTGQVLTYGWMHPTPGLTANTSTLNIDRTMTPIEYYSSKFNFWRGGIKLRFDFVASQFVTGRLWFGTHYGSGVPTSLQFLESVSQFGQMIDVADGKTSHEIVIPYRAATPWLRVPAGPLPDPGANDFLSTYLTYAMGTWSLRVVNPLVVPAGVPGTIHINVFISAADDYELNFLSLNNASLIVKLDTLPPPALEVEAQGLDTPASSTDGVPNNMAEESTEAKSESMGPSRAIALNNDHFQEKYTSVRDILKRYNPISRLTVSPTNFTNAAYLAGYSPTYATIKVEDLMRLPSLFKWFAAPYKLFRGSLRFKFVFRQVGALDDVKTSRDFSGFVWHDTSYTPQSGFPAPNAVAYRSTGSTCVSPPANTVSITPNADLYAPFYKATQTSPLAYFNAQSPYAEFEIPYVTFLNANPNPSSFNYVANTVTTTQSLGYLNVNMNLILGPVEIDIYMAIGDDARFGTFVGVPPVFTNYLEAPGGLKYPFGTDWYTA